MSRPTPPLPIPARPSAPVADWAALNDRITSCDRCPRLRNHCRDVAAHPRASYRHETYWAQPVPNFGDPLGRLLIVGLAPGAHGANRTGRMFTGDRSGDFLYPALHAAGFASQPSSTSLHDGLNLHDIAITAAAHCAPPANRPAPDELAHCSTHLRDTLAAMPNLQALIALGSIAFDACLALLRSLNLATFKPRPRFAHGLLLTPPSSPFLLASYHPSQQNTFTGVLTMPMLVKLLTTARDQLQRDEGPGSRA